MVKQPISISDGGCKQDWDAMTEHGCGRYCQLCERVVIDFTAKTSIEIKDYLGKHPDTCGRFYPYQVLPPPPPPKRNFIRTCFMVVSAFFSTAVSYVSAQSNKPATHKTQSPKTPAPILDTTQEIVVGKMVQDKIDKDSSKKSNSEYRPEIMGKPMFGQDTLPIYQLTHPEPGMDSSMIHKAPVRVMGAWVITSEQKSSKKHPIHKRVLHKIKPDHRKPGNC
jgi:hypothetical protein